MLDNTISINVFYGATGGRNNAAFSVALDKVQQLPEFRRLNFQENQLTNEIIRKRGWSEEQFADWLAEGDMYFMVNHPTLGNTNMQSQSWEEKPAVYWKPWNCETIVDVFHERLKTKIGWPEDTRCPSLWQTKIAYKKATKEVATPYLVIRKTKDGKLCEQVRGEVFE